MTANFAVLSSQAVPCCRAWCSFSPSLSPLLPSLPHGHGGALRAAAVKPDVARAKTAAHGFSCVLPNVQLAEAGIQEAKGDGKERLAGKEKRSKTPSLDAGRPHGSHMPRLHINPSSPNDHLEYLLLKFVPRIH